eukprot:m.215970 g.215970  ORF g.215970 m.215970 type:complete len:536 (+) comp33199_c0_seq3:411-2018(+)
MRDPPTNNATPTTTRFLYFVAVCGVAGLLGWTLRSSDFCNFNNQAACVQIPQGRVRVSERSRTVLRSNPPRQTTWGVVQIYDIRDGEPNNDYANAIVSTNEALKRTGMSPTVDHVVYVVQNYTLDEQNSRHELHTQIQETLAIFDACGMKIVTVADVVDMTKLEMSVDDFKLHFIQAGRFDSFFYKLTVFNMIEYDKLLWLDNDVVILQSFLPLFERAEAIDAVRTFELRPRAQNTPALYAVADVATGMCYNSGMMLFTPRSQDFEAIINLLRGPVTTAFDRSTEDSPSARLTSIQLALRSQLQRNRETPNDSTTGKHEPWVSSCTGEPRTDGDQEIIMFYFLSNNRLESLPPYYNTLVSHHSDSYNSPSDWVVDMPAAGKYMMWAFHSAESRSQLKLVHIGWPKPEWPIWKPDEAIPSDLKVRPEWKSKPLWFVQAASQGELGLSFLSLFKTYWKRIQDQITFVCARPANATSFKINIQQSDGQFSKRSVDVNLQRWCRDHASHLFVGEGFEHLSQGPHSLLLDKSIPLWNETL